MSSRTVVRWIRAGLLALPLYGLLSAWAALEPQPDQVADPEARARFVSSTSYLVGHPFGSTGGTVLATFGTFALGTVMDPDTTGASLLRQPAGTLLLAAGGAWISWSALSRSAVERPAA